MQPIDLPANDSIHVPFLSQEELGIEGTDDSTRFAQYLVTEHGYTPEQATVEGAARMKAYLETKKDPSILRRDQPGFTPASSEQVLSPDAIAGYTDTIEIFTRISNDGLVDFPVATSNQFQEAVQLLTSNTATFSDQAFEITNTCRTLAETLTTGDYGVMDRRADAIRGLGNRLEQLTQSVQEGVSQTSNAVPDLNQLQTDFEGITNGVTEITKRTQNRIDQTAYAEIERSETEVVNELENNTNATTQHSEQSRENLVTASTALTNLEVISSSEVLELLHNADGLTALAELRSILDTNYDRLGDSADMISQAVRRMEELLASIIITTGNITEHTITARDTANVLKSWTVNMIDSGLARIPSGIARYREAVQMENQEINY
jgi:uncharacterized phage infection (PIP) family protein YhgE